MSHPSDPADLHALAADELASVALGEAIGPELAEHVQSCLLCLREIAAYRSLGELARESDGDDPPLAPPPPELWERVVAALGDDAPVPAAPAVAEVVPLRRPGIWRRSLLAAAAVVAVGVAGVGGWAIGHRSAPSQSSTLEAALAPQPGTSVAVRGTAVVHSSGNGFTLSVSAPELPAPTGYYEVWLFNPSINQMVAVGALGAGGQGSFTVPDGIDLAAYHVVDVSAQRYNGDNTHQRSVLRGPLSS